jgi:hypothetical protein
MLSNERIQQIVDEGLAMYAANEARIVAERRSGLRCSCCNYAMPTPTDSGECAGCRELLGAT